MVTIDVTKLTDEQLTAFALIDSAAAHHEMQRRKSFPTIEEGMTALRAVHMKIATFLENTRHTQSVKAVVDTGIVETLEKFFMTAKLHGLPDGKSPLEMIRVDA